MTPTTISVPRNTTAALAFALDFNDATSGFGGGNATQVVSGGAVITALTGFVGAAPPTGFEFTVQMGGSTAGRVEWTFTMFDVAGNSSTCKAIARAK